MSARKSQTNRWCCLAISFPAITLTSLTCLWKVFIKQQMVQLSTFVTWGDQVNGSLFNKLLPVTRLQDTATPSISLALYFWRHSHVRHALPRLQQWICRFCTELVIEYVLFRIGKAILGDDKRIWWFRYPYRLLVKARTLILLDITQPYLFCLYCCNWL